MYCIHKALSTINELESRLAQEHHLRQTADNYLLDLNASRQQAVNSVAAVKDSEVDVIKHCKSVR